MNIFLNSLPLEKLNRESHVNSTEVMIVGAPGWLIDCRG